MRIVTEVIWRRYRRSVSRWSLLWTWLLFACLAGNAASQVIVGTIKDLRGTVEVQRNGRSIAATPAMPILAGDKLETSRQSSVTIALIDGSQLILSDASSVILDRAITSVADSTIELFKGKLRSVVNIVAGKLPEFEVHTPNAVASVRGTDFATEYIEGKPCPGFPQCLRYSDIGVYKGIVEVRNPTSLKPNSVRVAAGYETTVPCELPPANPAPLGIGDLTAPGY
ncbi:MAG: FecR domain-containing protein, partial [Deltaproteobacteria bacterium]|nr:FecR domain-containing protein [Deltaproteobacteria bacterium]